MDILNADEEKEKCLKWIQKLLGFNLQIKITDGRVLRGEFVCTDKGKNVVLSNSQEFHETDIRFTNPRTTGLVLVPGKHIIQIKRQQFPNDTFDGEIW